MKALDRPGFNFLETKLLLILKCNKMEAENIRPITSVPLERLQPGVISTRVILALNEVSIDDLAKIVETIKHKLEYFAVAGIDLGDDQISEFRQLFRIYDLYMTLLTTDRPIF